MSFYQLTTSRMINLPSDSDTQPSSWSGMLNDVPCSVFILWLIFFIQ
jgi:hypothetical protein